MKAIKRPYYALHKIDTGKYTNGTEYVLDDGSDYIGTYHILPNSQIFTQSQPSKFSKELHVKRLDIDESVKRYNRLTDSTIGKYISPVVYQPRPTLDDYRFGEIERYFVQKRNNPTTTIMEIDTAQFNTINTSNVVGINGVMWNSTILPWKISLISPESIAQINRREIQYVESKFTGIGIYLSNPLEFYR